MARLGIQDTPIYLYDTPDKSDALNNFKQLKNNQITNWALLHTPIKPSFVPINKRTFSNREFDQIVEEEDTWTISNINKKSKDSSSNSNSLSNSKISKIMSTTSAMEHDQENSNPIIIKTSKSIEFKDKVRNGEQLDEYLGRFLKQFERTLITRAGDVLVYSKNQEDIDIMLKNVNFFPD